MSDEDRVRRVCEEKAVAALWLVSGLAKDALSTDSRVLHVEALTEIEMRAREAIADVERTSRMQVYRPGAVEGCAEHKAGRDCPVHGPNPSALPERPDDGTEHR